MLRQTAGSFKFKIQNSKFRIQDSGFKIQDSGFNKSGFKILRLKFEMPSSKIADIAVILTLNLKF